MPKICAGDWRVKKEFLPASLRLAPAGWQSRLADVKARPPSCLSSATAVTAISRPAYSPPDAQRQGFSMTQPFRFCPQCATPLAPITQLEDGGEKERLRCVACGYTHWNNPTPVLAAVIEYQGKVLL